MEKMIIESEKEKGIVNQKIALLELFLSYCTKGIIINYQDKQNKLYKFKILTDFKYDLNTDLKIYNLDKLIFLIKDIYDCKIIEYDDYISILTKDNYRIYIDEMP